MAEQLVFSLVDDEPPRFANFAAGPNDEAVALLEAAASRRAGESIVLWGGEGAGKSHLLQAFVAAAAAAGARARFFAQASDVDDAALADDAIDAVAVDDIDRADEAAQARLFTLFNALRGRGGAFVASSRTAPARLALRDDLRTRLGWGLVLEIRVLGDADKPRALAAYARGRGFALTDEAIDWLLVHGRRDMRSLTRALASIDRYSLAQRRAVSLPLLREWLAAQALR